jgi:predicted nucleic acid-binding protein
MSLFVDTSVWYAAADSSDLDHSRARRILSSGEALVTTDHVFVETWRLMHHRIGRAAAEKFWQALRSGAGIIKTALAADREAAWQIGVSWRDQDFSIIDRTSFAVLQRLGVFRAASFDDDFAIYRFGPKRRQALVVVR